LSTSVPTAPQCSSFIRSGSATPVVHSGGNAKAQPSRAFLLISVADYRSYLFLLVENR
jgi:hypothetical protein